MAKMAGWIASVLVLLAASRLGTAQKTYCNPIVKACPPVPALGTSISVDFTTSESSLGPHVNQVNGPLTFDQNGNGLTLLIMSELDFPRAGISKYIFYGRVDVTMRTAPGNGIVTSFVLQSDDLDEIHFEWVGSDLDKDITQTNYFSKGCTATYDRGMRSATGNHTAEYHTYGIDWTPEKVDWLINDKVIRTLLAKDADKTECGRFPQSPMRISIGSWVAGKAGSPAGTIDWAGGLADFSKGPSSTYIRGINVTDIANGVSGAKQYRHRDMSGIAASVVVETSENAMTTEVSVVTQTGGVPPPEQGGSGPAGSDPGGEGRLSSSAITGIIVGFVAAGAIIGGLVLLVFLQRRKKRQRKMSKAGDGLVKDGGVVGGVDMKQELDGSAMSEMDAGPPEAKELDVKEMELELDTSGRDDTDVVSPLSPDTTGDTLVSPVQKKEEEEFYELPGDTPQR